MDSGARGWWAVAALLLVAGYLLWGAAVSPPAPLRLGPPPPATAQPGRAFPPAPAPRRPELHRGMPKVTTLDREIARLGEMPPRYASAARRAFAESDDLVAFVLGRLAKAVAGDGESQYLIYLALDQCRPYLRLDPEGARLLNERMQASAAELANEERAVWQWEYQRCRGFSGGDWGAVGEALGDDRPGSEVEYASVWFMRAVESGFPVALAEQALRLGPLDAVERRALLDDALSARDPDIDWLLFAHSGEAQAAEVNVPSLAWLVTACRAGADCTESARWYRAWVCAQPGRSCQPGQSALEYYWFAASAWERDRAWELAQQIEASLRAGRPERLPLPDLAERDTRRNEYRAPD